MKKLLCVLLCLILVIPFAFSVSASDLSLANDLAHIGQQTLYAGPSAKKAPVQDGNIDDGEYVRTIYIDKDTPGVYNTIGVAYADKVPDYVIVNVSYDDDFIYFGAVVQEDE